MVYVIVDGEIIGNVVLVRAEDRDEVMGRLSLKGNEKIVGSLTDFQLHALTTAGFTVITS